MSTAIEQRLKQLKEQERQLELEKRKIEFLEHIVESARTYDYALFADVKTEVVLLLEKFVNQTIEYMSSGENLEPNPKQVIKNQNKNEVLKDKVKEVSEQEASPAEKLNFALENRSLAGKRVQVINDKNIDIIGMVVGLDAPHVLVKTESGPTIKVPLEKINLA